MTLAVGDMQNLKPTKIIFSLRRISTMYGENYMLDKENHTVQVNGEGKSLH